MDKRNFVEGFNPTKKVGYRVSFDKNLQVVKINNEYFRYDEIEDFKCIENKNNCTISDHMKEVVAGAFVAQSLLVDMVYPDKGMFKKEAEELVELKFEFRIKGKPKVVTLDLMEQEENQIIIGTVKYQFYEKLKNDIEKVFTALLNKI